MSTRGSLATVWLVRLLITMLLVTLCSAVGTARAQCGGTWLTGPQHHAPGFDGPVYAYATMPNGDIVAAGSFTSVGGVPVTSIARWNGTTWSAMGNIGWRVNALAVAPNGDLIAGTGGDDNSNNGAVFRFNGSVWSQLGGDTDGSGGVMAVAVAPNGDVIAGGWFYGIGWFTGIPGVQASCIARWNGSAWSALGTPRPPTFPIPGLVNPINTAPAVVYAITVLTSGDIVAGGRFVGGTNASGPITGWNIARWNGSVWSALGPGLRGGINTVRAVGVLSNGQIVAAGGFYQGTSGIPVSNIATWNGTSWLPIGSGNDDPAGATTIYALQTLPGGEVIIGGDFPEWAGAPVNRIARWTGTTWTNYGTGVDNTVFALARATNGDVFAGGAFAAAGNAAASRAARWNGSQWAPVAAGLGLSDTVSALVTLPGGDVVAAGSFVTANGAVVSGLARWNGSAWSPMPPISPVSTLALDSNGDLLAGGAFPGGVARLSGGVWSALGTGVDGPVSALAVMPNGDVVAGGSFSNAGGVPANRIARFNGSTWAPLGSGVNTSVLALAVLQNGDLVAAGTFTTAGGSPASRIARWNGTAWSPFGAGLSGSVRALTVRPNGDLLAGGLFSGGIARWTGSVWSSLATDLYPVFALATRPNGDVIAGGEFFTAGGAPGNAIARWNGSTWSPLGNGIGGGVAALLALPSGEIFAGGAIASAGGAVSSFFARWSDTGIPVVSAQPAPQSANVGQTAALSATSAAGYDFNGPVTFQWHRNGQPITDGPAGASPAGGVVSGASGALTSLGLTTTLAISNVQPGDAGAYSVTFTNSCGAVTAAAATLSVTGGPTPCNIADITGIGGPPAIPDGLITGDDFNAFISAFAAGDLLADITGIGGPPAIPDVLITGDDFNAFIAAFAAGCP